MLGCRYQLRVLNDADPCCGRVLTSFTPSYLSTTDRVDPLVCVCRDNWVGTCTAERVRRRHRSPMSPGTRSLFQGFVNSSDALLSGLRLGPAPDDECLSRMV